MIKTLSLAAAIVVAISGCASSGSPAVRGQEIRIRYAEIVDVERTRLPSAAPAGAVVGGFTGLVLSRNQSTGRRVASGIGGAALGGLATAALEGDRLGYSYSLRYLDGTESRFITEKGYLQPGDCVSVERGEFANVRRVPRLMCEERMASIPESHVIDAGQCHAAKEQLLSAVTDDEIDNAARKVEILCDY
ncbi:MAG: hypothetical protein R3315_12585 [Woeseiaceae bacterium]|nr:hypothetical protein [Woeseiaceae bacterium]